MKFKKTLIVTLFCIILFLTMPFNPIVSAIPINWFLLDDFDDYTLGDYYGTNGDFEWERESGTNFYIAGSATPGGDKYLSLGQESDDVGWFNTSGIGYFGFFVRQYYHAKGSCGGYTASANTYYTWYNQTGDIIVEMKTRCVASCQAYYTISYKNYFNSWVDIYQLSYQSSGQSREISDAFVFGWNYYTDNIVQYFVYDNLYNLLITENGTANLSGPDFIDKEQFNCSSCEIYYDFTGSTSGTTSATIYEYGYIDEEIYGYTTFPQLEGVVVETFINGGWFTGLPDLCSGGTYALRFTAIGEDGCKMCVYIKDTISNETIFFACSLTDTLVYSDIFLNITTYNITVYDPLNYNSSNWFQSSFDVIDCGIPDFYALYGDFFAQFYTDGSLCYYIDNDHPELIYDLNDLTNYSTTDGKYILDIWRDWGMGHDRVYTTTLNDGDSGYAISIPSITLYNQYDYYIRVYSTTKSGASYIRDDVIYESNHLTPCADMDNDGIADPFDDYIGDEGAEDTISYFLPEVGGKMGVLLGLILTTFCLLTPFIIAASLGIGVEGIPIFVYAITGGMGIAISTYLHWFPDWIIFFIIAMGIIMTVFVFLYRGNTTGE